MQRHEYTLIWPKKIGGGFTLPRDTEPRRENNALPSNSSTASQKAAGASSDSPVVTSWSARRVGRQAFGWPSDTARVNSTLRPNAEAPRYHRRRLRPRPAHPRPSPAAPFADLPHEADAGRACRGLLRREAHPIGRRRVPPSGRRGPCDRNCGGVRVPCWRRRRSSGRCSPATSVKVWRPRPRVRADRWEAVRPIGQVGGQRDTAPPLLGAMTIARAGSTGAPCALPADSSALRHPCSAAEPRESGCAPRVCGRRGLVRSCGMIRARCTPERQPLWREMPVGYGGSGRPTAEFGSRRAGDLGTSE